MNGFPRELILNQKIEGMNFYENSIIICKLMDREKIFGGIRYMKDITKVKILNRVMNY
jgi:hypothetical protein